MCGCEATVTLNINDDEISETVLITEYISEDNPTSQIKYRYRDYMPAYAENMLADTEADEYIAGIKYYDKKEKNTGTEYYITYKYTFDIDDYGKAMTVKNGFKSNTIQMDKVDENVLLSTDSGGVLYLKNLQNLTKVNVNITVDRKVLEHNADSVVGNTYYWTFTKDNNSKGVYLLLDDSKEEEKEEEKKESEEEKENNYNNGETTQKKEEEESNSTKAKKKLEEKANKHPFILIIICIIVFLIFVFMVTKVEKIKK